jgi:hypothetical protein
VRESPLPFGAGPAPQLELAGVESPFSAAATLLGAASPALLAELVVFAAVAVAIPFARDPWRIAGLGAAMLAGTLLVAPATPALPLVLTAWLTVSVLAGARLVARDEH